jgi:hypothetical protein
MPAPAPEQPSTNSDTGLLPLRRREVCGKEPELRRFFEASGIAETLGRPDGIRTHGVLSKADCGSATNRCEIGNLCAQCTDDLPKIGISSSKICNRGGKYRDNYLI